MEFGSYYKPRNSSFAKPKADAPTESESALEAARRHFQVGKAADGRTVRTLTRADRHAADDLPVEEVLLRIQHRWRKLKETHAVFEWSYGERMRMERKIDQIILRIDAKKPLTRAQMKFVKDIVIPAKDETDSSDD